MIEFYFTVAALLFLVTFVFCLIFNTMYFMYYCFSEGLNWAVSIFKETMPFCLFMSAKCAVWVALILVLLVPAECENSEDVMKCYNEASDSALIANQ